MNVNVQMSETNQLFVAQLNVNDRDFKVIFTLNDMLIHTAFKEEVS